MLNEFPKMNPGEFCIRFTELEIWPGVRKDWDGCSYSEVFSSLRKARRHLKSLPPRGELSPARSIINHMNEVVQ